MLLEQVYIFFKSKILINSLRNISECKKYGIICGCNDCYMTEKVGGNNKYKNESSLVQAYIFYFFYFVNPCIMQLLCVVFLHIHKAKGGRGRGGNFGQVGAVSKRLSYRVNTLSDLILKLLFTSECTSNNWLIGLLRGNTPVFLPMGCLLLLTVSPLESLASLVLRNNEIRSWLSHSISWP